MKNVPILEELREIRRRLAQEHEYDPERYAAMLRDVERNRPGVYLTHPIMPPADPGAGATLGTRVDVRMILVKSLFEFEHGEDPNVRQKSF